MAGDMTSAGSSTRYSWWILALLTLGDRLFQILTSDHCKWLVSLEMGLQCLTHQKKKKGYFVIGFSLPLCEIRLPYHILSLVLITCTNHEEVKLLCARPHRKKRTLVDTRCCSLNPAPTTLWGEETWQWGSLLLPWCADLSMGRK